MQTAERRVKNESNNLVSKPYIIKMYNNEMAGVDLCERMLALYRPQLRTERRCWNIFSNMLYLTVLATHVFHQHIEASVATSHRQFRREIARALIEVKEAKEIPGRPLAQRAKALR